MAQIVFSCPGQLNRWPCQSVSETFDLSRAEQSILAMFYKEYAWKVLSGRNIKNLPRQPFFEWINLLISSQSVKLRFLAPLPARKFQEENESRDDPTSWGPTCFWNNTRLGGRAVQSEICKYIPPPQPKDPQDCMYVFARAKINSKNPQIPLLPSSSSERQTKYMRLPLKCNKSWAAIIN